tara:strand:- start:629 stop:1219 length:591 start_codon:yes stop_codon:yes gene_type:complete
MKNIPFIILVSVVLLSCNSKLENNPEKKPIDLPNTEWKEVISEEGNFKILFPDLKLRMGTDTFVNEEGGKSENHYFRLNIQDSLNLNMAYDITYTYRTDLETEEEMEKMFEIEKEFLISTLNAKINFVKVLEEKDYFGREIVMTIDNSKFQLSQRFYVNKGILYVLKVLTNTNEGKIFNKSRSKFFDSFEIVKQEA